MWLFLHFLQHFCILAAHFSSTTKLKMKSVQMRKVLLLWKIAWVKSMAAPQPLKLDKRTWLIRPNMMDTVLPHRIKIPPLLFKTLSIGLLRCARWGYHIRGGWRRSLARGMEVVVVVQVLRETWQKAQPGHGRRVGPTCQVSVKRR